MAAAALSGIYEIVNLVNGKRYVGSAVNLERRWRQHRKRLMANSHHSRHLQSAWNKHGTESFDFRILKTCDVGALLVEEQAEFDRRKPEYNVCPTAGSTLGRLHSKETRRKIGAKKVGTKLPPRDAEYRAKMSAAHKGRPKSSEHFSAFQAGRKAFVRNAEHCADVSDSLRKAFAEGRKSRERPPEYREKIAAGLRGKTLTPEHRANVAAAMTGKKRGPYKIDPAKAEAKREAGRKLAATTNESRWGHPAK